MGAVKSRGLEESQAGWDPGCPCSVTVPDSDRSSFVTVARVASHSLSACLKVIQDGGGGGGGEGRFNHSRKEVWKRTLGPLGTSGESYSLEPAFLTQQKCKPLRFQRPHNDHLWVIGKLSFILQPLSCMWPKQKDILNLKVTCAHVPVCSGPLLLAP